MQRTLANRLIPTSHRRAKHLAPAIACALFCVTILPGCGVFQTKKKGFSPAPITSVGLPKSARKPGSSHQASPFVGSTAKSKTTVAPIANISPEAEDKMTAEYEARRDAAALQAAHASFDRTDYATCREQAKQLLVRSPNCMPARLLAIDACMLMQDYDGANRLLDEGLVTMPGDPELVHAQALLLAAEGDEQEAARWATEAVALSPKNETFQATRAQFEEAALAKPKDAGKKSASNSQGRDDHVARQAMSDRATSAEGAALVDRGAVALTSGNVAEATRLWRAALHLETQSDELAVAIAGYALQSSQTDVAIAVLDDAIERSPNNAILYRMAGVACYRAGALDLAQLALRQALSLDNRAALTYLLLGYTLDRAGKIDEARQAFAEAKRLDPSLAQH